MSGPLYDDEGFTLYAMPPAREGFLTVKAFAQRHGTEPRVIRGLLKLPGPSKLPSMIDDHDRVLIPIEAGDLFIAEREERLRYRRQYPQGDPRRTPYVALLTHLRFADKLEHAGYTRGPAALRAFVAVMKEELDEKHAKVLADITVLAARAGVSEDEYVKSLRPAELVPEVNEGEDANRDADLRGDPEPGGLPGLEG